MKNSKPLIGIIGAGIGGLAAAAALRARGLNVRIFEQTDRPPPSGPIGMLV